jgi:conjugal transfer pilus assembly protein TraW
VSAKDFGKVGTSFIIKEEGFLKMIKRRLGEIDITKHQKIMQDQTEARIREPKPVEGLVKTVKARQFEYDPTYTLEQDAKLPDGTILYAAGTTVNPLEKIEIDYKVYFINGHDKAQVNWVMDLATEHDQIILVAGRPLELQEEFSRNIYFDQFGELIKKTKIQQVPAVMWQQGKVMLIDEVRIDG